MHITQIVDQVYATLMSIEVSICAVVFPMP